MGIATGMKELTRDIAFSHRARARRLGEIRRETKQARGEAQHLIHSFTNSRHETNRQLKQDLARDKARRKSETTAILEAAQNIIKDFTVSRKEASAQLRKDLSQGAIERKSEVKKTLAGAQKLIRGFHTSRQKVSNQLRKDLGQNRAKVKSEVGELRGNAQSIVKDLQTSRKESGGQLRRDLAQSRANLESNVKQMQNDFREARGNVRTDLKGAKAAWQGLASAIQVSGVVKPPPKTEAPTVKGGNHDLETKMLTAISEHPEGITLAGIADSLGVASVVLGNVSKSLIKKRKIHKEEKLYFPAAASESEAKQGLHFRPPVR